MYLIIVVNLKTIECLWLVYNDSLSHNSVILLPVYSIGFYTPLGHLMSHPMSHPIHYFHRCVLHASATRCCFGVPVTVTIACAALILCLFLGPNCQNMLLNLPNRNGHFPWESEAAARMHRNAERNFSIGTQNMTVPLGHKHMGPTLFHKNCTYMSYR